MTERPPPPPLPPLPRIAVRVVRDRTATASATGGFLNLARLDLVTQQPDGTTSDPFPYDLITRAALDAVVIVAHGTRDGRRCVFLRSAVRPPLVVRPPPGWHDGALWELPAGLVEPGETPEEAAARELAEEIGIQAAAKVFRPLGPPTFPAPAFIAEQHVFFHVEVDLAVPHGPPTEDGSAVERGATIACVPLEAALEHCRRGTIRDEKSELGLRRLAEAWG